MTRTKVLRPVIVIPVVVVIAGAAVFFGFRSGSRGAQAAAATQQLYAVAPTTLSQTVSASGTIAPADTEDLNFGVSGTVANVSVKAGATVTKGQTLATIESATLLSSVAQAKSTLTAAQASLSDDESASSSTAQIADDQAQVTSAYAAFVSATSDLSDATLTSPINGTIATMNLTVGETLGSSGATGTDLSGTGTGSGRTTAASSSATGANNTAAASTSTAQIEVISSAYVVNLSVDTTTVGNIEVGQAATVTPMSTSGTSTTSGAGGFGPGGGFGGGGFAAAGAGGAATAGGGQSTTTGSSTANAATATAAATKGSVSSVGAIASASSGVATFPVVIAVAGTPTGFHAGASASAVITYKSYPNVIAVPTTAITRTNGQSTVTVSVNGATTARAVTTGIVSSGQTEITDGLTSGEQIVVTVPSFRRTTTGASGTGGATRFPGGGGEVPAGAGPGGATP